MPLAADSRGADGRGTPARYAVVAYYDDCQDDYRILWRTDENGSIHFGFFDLDEKPSLSTRLRKSLRMVRTHGLGTAAAIAAGGAALMGGARGRAKSVDWLRVAARGD